MTPQFPIIIKPPLVEQALAATPKAEPFQPPVIPSPEPKPRKFKTGLLAAQALILGSLVVVFTIFGQFGMSFFLGLVLVALLWTQIHRQGRSYPHRLRRWEANVQRYERQIQIANQRKRQYQKLMARLQTPEGLREYRRELVKEALNNTRLNDGDKSQAKIGESEVYFKTFLNKYFPEKIFTNHEIRKPGSDRPYTPDFTYIESAFRLYIDIEIDEPYAEEIKKPIHYIGLTKDEERNEYIAQKYGWFIIRFSEEQVVRSADSCCKRIAQLLAEITLDDTYLEPFIGIPDLIPEPQWTREEANVKASNNYRHTYLDLIPKPEKSKPKKVEQVKLRKEFKPSQYQLDIFDFIENGTGHGLVVAVAGSGKSTTLLQAARLVKDKRAIFLAFNNSIAKELAHKLKEVGASMEAKTIHSLGYEAVRAKLKKPDIIEQKYNELIPQGFSRNDHYLPFIRLCRTNLVDITNRDDVRELAIHFNIDVDYADSLFPKLGEILERGKQVALEDELIDFTDLLWLPLTLEGLPMRTFDWIFVDECQDLSPLQLELVLKSLNPGGRILFVGDPKQAIYGFAGADCQSVQKIQTRTNATELPLSICYRCPKTHLDLAREIVPQIEARPGAPDGMIEEIKYEEVAEVVQPGDLIICRLTSPLIRLGSQLMVRRVKAHVKGHDIAKELLDIVQKTSQLKGFSFRNFTHHLTRFAEERIQQWNQRWENSGLIPHFQDQIEAIKAAYLASDSDTLEDYCRELEALFRESTDGGVTLCTVHKAKGLEADRVFILEPNKLPLVRQGQKEWEMEQELHLRYVALTRAKQELYFIQPV